MCRSIEHQARGKRLLLAVALALGALLSWKLLTGTDESPQPRPTFDETGRVTARGEPW
jgi:hypothetical protein